MTVYISRDYSSAGSGYSTNKFFAAFPYTLALYLNKILGYSVVSTWGFNINNTAKVLTITASTNTNPPTITTNLPHGLMTGDTVQVTGANQNINGTSMVGAVPSPTQAVLLNLIPNAPYTANSGTLFCGFLYASGSPGGNTGANINIPGASSVYAVSIPFSQKAVAASDINKPLVLKSTSYPTKNTGVFKILSLNQGNTTTIAIGSNNVSLPQTTINVASTTSFPASGTIYVVTTAGTQQVTYTGTSGGNQFTGCLGGTGTMNTGNLVSNLNAYNIDYRSSDTPPPENSAAGPLTWWLYETETQVSQYMMNNALSGNQGILAATSTTPITITFSSQQPGYVTGQTIVITGATGNTGVNGTFVVTQVPTANNQYVLNGSVSTGTYNASTASANIVGYYGDGYNYNNRIILQSPHASGWQTRICVEPTAGGVPLTSVSTGFGGNIFADFPIGGVTNYIPLFFNLFALGAYVNTTTGGGNSGTANRYTFVGDDGGQNVFLYSRSLGGGNNGIMSIGIPDNEPIPNAVNTDRSYVYGSMQTGDFGGIQIRPTIGNCDTVAGNIGTSYHSGIPELVMFSSWVPLEGSNNGSTGAPPNSLTYSANAADSPFTGTTEVMPIEVWGGFTTDPALNIPQPSSGVVAFSYNQRFMGTAPYLRYGRVNFGNFALSTDTITTLTVSTVSGNGVSPIQVTTTATNALTTGQTVVISGVNGNTAANGTFVITVLSNTQFTLNGTTGNGTYTTGGTVNGTPHWLHLQNGVYLLWNGAAGLTP